MATARGSIKKAIEVVDESIGIYQRNWQKFSGALIGVFLITFFIGLINFLVGMLGGMACESGNPVILLLFCSNFFSFIGQIIVAFFLGFLAVVFTLALLKPFDELIERRVVTSWTLYFTKNFGNAAVVALFRLNINALLWLPFLLFCILDYGAINDKLIRHMTWSYSRLLGSSLFPFIIAIAATMAVAAIVNYLLIFLEAEIILGKKHVFQAAVSSYKLTKGRLGETLSFTLMWYAVGVLLWLAGSTLGCLTCLLNPLVWIAWVFALYPIQVLSTVLLWKRVKEFKEEEKRVIETPVSPEEYIRKAKTKMVLSWE